MKTLRLFAMVACFVSVSALAYPRPGETLTAVRPSGKTSGRGKLSETHTKRVVDTLRKAVAESRKNGAEAKTG
ncbi:MAG: hypothetical protein HN849_01020 [Victivallales bacterium]|nr:hypothetical protein [Victivallales bacterium]